LDGPELYANLKKLAASAQNILFKKMLKPSSFTFLQKKSVKKIEFFLECLIFEMKS
jgi:hypothetical protein